MRHMGAPKGAVVAICKAACEWWYTHEFAAHLVALVSVGIGDQAGDAALQVWRRI